RHHQSGAQSTDQLALVRAVAGRIRNRRRHRRVAARTRPHVAAPAFRRARGHRGAGNDARAPGGSRAMSYRVLLLAALAGACACNGAPGRPAPDSAVIAPDKVVDFDVLYATNCAGCHGANGTGGAAIGLADPVYLAIADDATIRRVTADGVPGTAMPA